MAHLRKQIRDNVVTALTGLSTTGSRVYAMGVAPSMFGRRANPCPREGGERRSYRPKPRRQFWSGRKGSEFYLRGVFALVEGAVRNDAQLFDVIAEIANVADVASAAQIRRDRRCRRQAH